MYFRQIPGGNKWIARLWGSNFKGYGVRVPTGENKRLEGVLSTAEKAGVALGVVEGEVQNVQASLAASQQESTDLQVRAPETLNPNPDTWNPKP